MQVLLAAKRKVFRAAVVTAMFHNKLKSPQWGPVIVAMIFATNHHDDESSGTSSTVGREQSITQRRSVLALLAFNLLVIIRYLKPLTVKSSVLVSSGCLRL